METDVRPEELRFRIFSVRENRPAFSYSVGLAPAGFPELIVFNLRETIAASLLNRVARDLIAGKTFDPTATYEDYLVGYPIRFRRASSSEDYAHYAVLGTATARAPMPQLGTFDVLQVVWSDHDRRFPEAPGYTGEIQPML